MTDQPTPTADDLPAGQIQFVEHYLPGLPDGAYDLQLSQTISATGATVTPATERMVVAGPRFALSPGDVQAQYPPPGASSHFAEVLPHAVFTKRLLPWERLLPTGDPSVAADPATPWLALLTFQPGELIAPQGVDPTQAAIAGYAETMTVSHLLGLSSSTVRVPTVTPDTSSEADMACQVITVSAETFAALVPTRRELPFLAHGREVDMAGKPLVDMPHQGEFSVVVANRFPQPGTPTVGAPCIAHLVSLEGFGDLLGGTAPIQPTEATVKIVSLLCWTFSCLQEEAQTFSGLATNLAFDAQGAPRPATELVVGLGQQPPQPPPANAPDPNPQADAAAQRISDGYVALGYHTRTGDDGFAWYRGPLAPTVTTPSFAPGAFKTADAAMIFDPPTGVFDLSLAAAWQCGRSLALADQAFAEALMRLRQRARDQVHAGLVGRADLAGGTGEAHAALASLVRGGLIERIGSASRGAELPRPQAAEPIAVPAPATRLRALLADPAARAGLCDLLDDDADAAAVAAWLGQVLLLEGIPFDHLIPDARMLPAESLRFFYLDAGWTGALVDGALAVGLGTSEESAVQDALSAELAGRAQAAALAARATALDLPLPLAPLGPTSGVIIRSALVVDWPTTVVSGTANGAPVPLLRLDVVQPDVLVALFAGVPDAVTLEEPHEGLAFGVDDIGQLVMRTLQGSTIVDGQDVTIYDPDAPTTPFASLRAGGSRVLNVNTDPAFPTTQPPPTPVDLLGMVAKGLGIGTASLDPAIFALQMVRGPELLTFATPTTPEPTA